MARSRSLRALTGLETAVRRGPDPWTADLIIGEAMSRTWSTRREWIRRKVDSARLEEENRGRRRISLDLVVPTDPALSYDPPERALPLAKGKSPLVVPLALMAKETLREFDIALDGKPVSVLTTRESSAIMSAAVLVQFSPEKHSPRLRDQIDEALRARPPRDRGLTDHILRDAADPSDLSADGELLLRNLTGNFLLLALISRDRAGQRVVLKYSQHWDRILPQRDPARPISTLLREIRDSWLPATGQDTATLEIDLSGADDAESYHLEVHAPPSLTVVSLTMPSDETSTPPPAPLPPGGNPRPGLAGENGHVAATQPAPGTDPHQGEQPAASAGHVVQTRRRYTSPVTEPASLALAGTNSGPRSVALTVSLYTAAVFLGALLLPGAFPVWTAGGSQVTSLLLAVPAAAMATLNRQPENVLASYFWRPVRLMVFVCAALLMAGAAALAIGWQCPALWYAQWILSGAISILFFLQLLLGIRAKMTTGQR